MSETEPFDGKIEWLGWDKPAVNLVAERLLALREKRPHTFRRAIVVVPTAESGRRLREVMLKLLCEKEKRNVSALLMPRLCMMGQLLTEVGTNVASEHDTLAAWLQELLPVAEAPDGAKWPNLFPHAPLGNKETWAVSMVNRLRLVRHHLEQEELTADYAARLQYVTLPDGSKDAALQKYLDRMGARWNEMQEIFARVDRTLQKQGKITREEARAALLRCPAYSGLLILACVPEVPPQIRTYLRALQAKPDATVQVWVNAPETEALHFDAFGQPLTEYWQQCPIDIPHALVTEEEMTESGKKSLVLRDDLSVIHQVPDVKALAEKTICLAGGQASDAVCIAACDASVSQTVHTAFLNNPDQTWRLNLPTGRSFLMTPAGQLPARLSAVLQTLMRLPDFDPVKHRVRDYEGTVMPVLEPLLRNETLQHLFCNKGKTYVSLHGFDRHLDKVLLRWLPASVKRLSEVIGLDPTPPNPKHPRTAEEEERDARARAVYADYVGYVVSCLEKCQRVDSLATLWKSWGKLLPLGYEGLPLKKTLEAAAQKLLTLANFAATAPESLSAYLLLLIWQQEMQQLAEGALVEIPREECCGDIIGWRELTFAPEPQLILCGMHQGCVPENPKGDAVLPDALRVSFGITSSASREARDSFLLTALLKGHRVRFILARNKADGTPIVPSSLLLRCRTAEELAKRAALLFGETDEIPAIEEPTPWLLLKPETRVEPQNESLALFGAADKNLYALGGEKSIKTFSPSRLNDFLQCPLRFWLKTIWKIAPGDAYQDDLLELAPNTYGSLMHAVLQSFVKRFPNALSVQGEDAESLGGIAADMTMAAFRDEYGEQLTLPLQAQAELLQANMRLFAACHLKDVEQGWENVALEQKLEPSLDMPDAPAAFDMNADRIDRRRRDDGTWQYRIIDYKSNDKPPVKQHFIQLKGTERERYYRWLEPWTFKVGDSENPKLYRWKNVQLPLYALGVQKWVEETYNTSLPENELPELAYYNIPSGKVEVKYNKLMSPQNDRENFSAGDLQAALVCVRDVIAKIRAGECLFSVESLGGETPTYADFGALCPDGDPRNMCGLPSLAD